MKFIDHNSPEKTLLKDAFNSLPYIDMWISSIVEGYIYENVLGIDKYGYREEYIERYRKKEGEYKKWWYDKKQLWVQCYYKRGELEGKYKVWLDNGQIRIQCYYKEGKLEGEYKSWHRNRQISFQEYYKEGKREGEGKWWNEQGELIVRKIYKNNEVIKDILNAP